MVKTTINLRDDIYKKLVKEVVEKYGNTKNISKLINEKLESAMKGTTHDSDIKKRLEIVARTSGAWKTKETGREYVKEIRAGWRRRTKGTEI
jgi:predicted CopG family antitoxin